MWCRMLSCNLCVRFLSYISLCSAAFFILLLFLYEYKWLQHDECLEGETVCMCARPAIPICKSHCVSLLSDSQCSHSEVWTRHVVGHSETWSLQCETMSSNMAQTCGSEWREGAPAALKKQSLWHFTLCCFCLFDTSVTVHEGLCVSECEMIQSSPSSCHESLTSRERRVKLHQEQYNYLTLQTTCSLLYVGTVN